METKKENQVKISVRNLVEFILRSGDLDNRTGGRRELDAMQEGSRIHRKIQKQMGANYSAEFPLSITIPMERNNLIFDLTIEGRADGVISNQEEGPSIIIDEIKGVYKELSHMEEPVPVHLAQVKCYAYIYAKLYEHEQIGVRLTYCNLETENIKYFEETLMFRNLEHWFNSLVKEYGKWAAWQISWRKKRDASIKNVDFPFSYRPGQKDLVTNVYKTILRDKRLFIEAPTGVGKTISTVFPAVKAMGEGLASKIFYLTAKTITRTVAEETYHKLMERGLLLKSITITAKDKICILEKPDCNPAACQRAKGHYDRVNEAVFDLLNQQDAISRELVLACAAKHDVCPFEMCLDVTLWADSIICDYNYAFDPNVYLRRFFQGEKKNDYIFLIDEAHNLVDRAREMYSAVLYKKDFLTVKKLIRGGSAALVDRTGIGNSTALVKRLEACNADLLKLKRECDNCRQVESITDLIYHLMRLMTEYEEYLTDYKSTDEKEELLQLYMNVRHFMNIYELYNDKYITYTDYDEDGAFRIKLLCMNPADNLNTCLERGKSAIFFSATLLPIQYYKEQLAGREEDYAVYAPSPFHKSNRIILIGRDVSTKYTRRSKKEYEKILNYIKSFTEARKGNYMVFFPSYQMLNQVAELAEGAIEGLVAQKMSMTEMEKEEFLQDFIKEPDTTRVGFCVMGGIFSEGIDLKNDRLIGAVIVGTGLPMVCNERELFKEYYDNRSGNGFDYAYLYQGMNKVLQSAGRVIRTLEDTGAILLLDERFLQRQYSDLFPREWYPNIVVDATSMSGYLNDFWSGI
ncbi:ATP-dependent helicase [Anaerocolumna cellulosilytica]|uniref:ATP-dependent helicase n=1 Tax=Anaerocolumna cellulosilytica TaxID=433286 RepID=A0A6S6QZ56_9FIRM|nr:ATP-dependent DNA helicase [Anaerocolumna cellulosilytica]MBB5198023.1 Rad3-related DNA helicase [Anaerocolumna cellulosilytica]BCJ93147.1 ATP-dependent helicase [Anaerocolumna cellulosilytica]